MIPILPPLQFANAWSPCVRLMFNCENHLKHFTAPYWLRDEAEQQHPRLATAVVTKKMVAPRRWK
jgi:hypothetical protein